LESAANLAESGKIEPQHLRIPIKQRPAQQSPDASSDQVLTMAEVERSHIVQTYQRLNSNKSRTARALGIGLQTLHRKLKSYGVK
ncbi:MAG: helix-turn-helix domain-containing protein, partial [Candidatus Alcyoniella australis]|nr:helix-turn-helix domain-containing protein [Candidatus Alcyoniella australis]